MRKNAIRMMPCWKDLECEDRIVVDFWDMADVLYVYSSFVNDGNQKNVGRGTAATVSD